MMTELKAKTLEERMSSLEQKMDRLLSNDWRSVVGISDDNEFTRQMIAEIEAGDTPSRLAAWDRLMALCDSKPVVDGTRFQRGELYDRD